MSCAQNPTAFGFDRLPFDESLRIYYRGDQPLEVRGGATGKVYQFSELTRVQPVDPRDAVFLLSSKHFRLTL